MARYEITAPDGSRYEVTAPDNATEADVMAYARSQFQRPKEKPMDPTADMSTSQKLLAGAGKAFVDIGRGAGQLLGMVSPEQVAESRRLDESLMKTGAGTIGNIAGNVAAAIPAAFVPGANTVAGAGAIGGVMGALQPRTEGESLTKNIGTGAAFGAGGQYALGKLAGAAKSRFDSATQRATAEQAQNATRDVTAKTAQELGYTIPPTQMNPSVVNKALEGLAGKISTGQAASIKNQGITDALVRKEFNLSPETPLVPTTFESIRKKAGGAYQSLKSIPKFQADDEFVQSVNALGGEIQQLAKEVPEMANPQIQNLIEALNKPEFTGQTTVSLLKKLRFDGGKNIANLDPEKSALGRAQLSAAEVLEGLVERNLENAGSKTTLSAFRNARQTIAKSYSVESALNEAKGSVNATKLASQLSKGKPLSGNLREIAQFAQAFPKAAQQVDSSMPGVSPLDYMAGLLGAGTAGPVGAAAAGVRPVARSVILSPQYQQRMLTPNYAPGLLTQRAPGVLSEAERMGLGLLAPSVYFGQQ